MIDGRLLHLAGAAWMFVVLGALCCRAEEGRPPPATVGLDGIRQDFAEWRSRVRSIYIQYLLATADPASGELTAGRSRHVIAARGPLRYASHVHWDRFFTEDLDLNQHEVFFTGETLDVFYVKQRYFETSKRNAAMAFADKIRANVMLECLAWWPPDDQSTPPDDSRPFYLHRFLEQDDCRLLPQQEKVGRHWCHVVERPNSDKLWFDAGDEYALRRRERYDGKYGLMTSSYELSDFVKTPGGVLFPQRMRRVKYDLALAQPGQPPAIASDARYQLEVVKLNEAPDRLFLFSPPPGTLVQDRDTRECRQIPGGLELLDEVVTTLREYQRIRTTLAGAEHTARPLPPQAYAVLVIVIALAGLNVRLFWGAVARRNDLTEAAPSRSAVLQ